MREGRHPSYKLLIVCCCCCSVTSNCLGPHGLQPARLHCPLLFPRVCSNSCPSNQWCHPTISSSITLFSFCPQSFPASESFPMSQLFASGGQSIGALASASGNLVRFNAVQTSTWDGRSSLTNWKAEVNKLPPILNWGVQPKRKHTYMVHSAKKNLVTYCSLFIFCPGQQEAQSYICYLLSSNVWVYIFCLYPFMTSVSCFYLEFMYLGKNCLKSCFERILQDLK